MEREQEGSPFQKVNGTEPHDDTETTEDPGVKKQTAPDGGWGWVVVFGFCISHFILGLIHRAFGVIYLILIDEFHASATATIWIGAIAVTCTLSIGALASALCRRFGCRRVSMAGGAMVVTGVIATGQAPNIYVIYITYGLLTGLGLGFIYTPGYIIISEYFNKRKALALSMTSVANGTSALVCPPLLLFLVREYGFSGMFLILGGVCLHLFVGAFLYRPLNPKVKTSAAGNAKKTNGSLCCMPRKRWSINDKGDDANDNSLMTPAATSIEDKKQEDVKDKTMKERYLALFKNYAFVAFAVLSMSLISGASMISSLLPAIAVDNGIDEARAAFLISISAVSGVIGSLALGHLFDVAAIRRFREHIYAGWSMTLGVGVLLMGVVSTYPAYITLSVLTGTATGLLMPQRITIIGDIVGKTSDMEGFGVVTFMNGFGGLFGRVIAGPIKDFSGCYNMAYLLSGSFAIMANLLFEVAVLRHERMQRRQQLKQTERAVHDT